MKIDFNKIKRNFNIRNNSYETFYSIVKLINLTLFWKRIEYKRVKNRLSKINTLEFNLK